MSVQLIEKLNGPQVLSGMLNRIFKSESPELTDVLSAISNPDPDGPRVYAIDTEFYQPHTGGGRKISEVAFVDVKTGQIVVDAVLNDEKRAVEASTKLAAYKLLQDSSTSQHVRQIHTAVEMFEQLENCRFRPKDKITEWSLQRYSCLDLNNTHLVLKQNGYESQRLLPKSSYALIKPIQKFLEPVLKLEKWSLPLVFRVLFPKNSLVDLNHTAAVDAVQVTHILKLLAELTKDPEQRSLPEGLLHGFKDLAWLDESVQSNTLDCYFESVGYEPSDAASEAENREFNDTRVYNTLVGYEDQLTGDESLDEEDLDVIDEDADAEYTLPTMKVTTESTQNDASRKPNAPHGKADTKEPRYSLRGRKRRDTANEQGRIAKRVRVSERSQEV